MSSVAATPVDPSRLADLLVAAFPDVDAALRPGYAYLHVPWAHAGAAYAFVWGLGHGVQSMNQEAAQVTGCTGYVELATEGPLREGGVVLANAILALDRELPGGLPAFLATGQAIPKRLSGNTDRAGDEWSPTLHPRWSIVGRATSAWEQQLFGQSFVPESPVAETLGVFLADAVAAPDLAFYTWGHLGEAADAFVADPTMLSAARVLEKSRPAPARRARRPRPGVTR